MADQSSQLVQKLWNYCNILRDDGLSYGDYVEQLTFLLFLKMADEQSRPPFNKPSPIPKGFDWAELARQATATSWKFIIAILLENSAKRTGMLGVIFRKAQNKIQDPAKLRRLIVDLIDKEQWSSLVRRREGRRLRRAAGEERRGRERRRGPILHAAPADRGDRRRDAARAEDDDLRSGLRHGRFPAGGVRLLVRSQAATNSTVSRKSDLATETLCGVELVDGVARLCCMNLLLHGISADGADEVPVEVRDALGSQGGKNYEMVLTNPPFGKKSSVTIVNEEGEAEKESADDPPRRFLGDRPATSSSTSSSTSSRSSSSTAAPRSSCRTTCSSKAAPARRSAANCSSKPTCTRLLRLPTGIFYAQGVKANVLFFDRKPAQEKPWTEKLWIYDLRTNKHFTLKENPLKRADLDDFVACYHAENRHERTESERFKCFTYDELAKRDKVNLDIFWLKDESLEDSANLPAPDIIAAEIVEDLEAALAQFAEIAADLGRESTEVEK